MAELKQSVRVLGNVVDGLVRLSRARLPTAPSLADRAMKCWEELPDAELRLDATRLYVDDAVVLEAGSDEGRWLLPAFMAGLRSIRRTSRTEAEDMLRLAEELASLESTVTAIGRFRDWLWADGAEGFEVVVDDSFTEEAELAFIDPEVRRRELMAARTKVAEAMLSDEHRVAERDLAVAAGRAEFHVPMQAYSASAEAGRLGLSDDEKAELLRACEGSLAWSDGQVYLALAHPALQSALPPRTLARRLVHLAAGRGDLRLLHLLRSLLTGERAGTRELLDALEEADLAEVLAASLEPVPAAADALTALVDLESPIVSELLRGLLRRCPGDARVAGLVGRMIRVAGSGNLCECLRPSSLDAKAAAALFKLLVHLKTSKSELLELVRQLPGLAVLCLVSELPTAFLVQLSPRLERVLAEVSPEQSGPVLLGLLGRGNRQLVELVGRVFCEAPERTWNRNTCGAIMAALAGGGLGGRFLVPMVRNRSEADERRMLALDLLDGSPTDQARAVKRSVTDPLDSQELRMKRREKRRRLKMQGHG